MNPENLAQAAAFFWENFEKRGEVGAAVSIWQHGREILSLAGGTYDRPSLRLPERRWTEETPVLVWSATKGPAAACLLHALARHDVPLGTPVRSFWPEFAQAGKEAVTFAEVLSHRAGLAALDSDASVLDHSAVAAALAAQKPEPLPGEGHAYHPRTFGFLLDELVRRVDGMPLGEYWRHYFGVPLDLDFWIGAPPEKHDAIAPIQPARAQAGSEKSHARNACDTAFYQAMGEARSLTARAFKSPRGLYSVAGMNTAAVRSASFPAFGGIGTAHALAKFYAMLANGGTLYGLRPFESIEPMTTTLSDGPDRVLLRQTAFSAGFMRDPLDATGRKTRQLFGPSLTAFGQPGAGGSHAFADPENGIAFAYVMNQMEPGVMPNEKAMGIVRALYTGVRAGAEAKAGAGCR